jgi:hypothetical protein
VIHYSEAMLGLILVRFFASAELVDNRLPNGWQFTARPKGDGIAIDLSEGHTRLSSPADLCVIILRSL